MPKVKKNKNAGGGKNGLVSVPYVKGFRPPTARQQIQAIDPSINADSSKLPAEYQPTNFEPIPTCSSIDDWLAQYNEEGQTFEDFLVQCPWLSTRKRRYMKQKFVSKGNNLPEKYPEGKIYILPLGDFSPDSSPAISELVRYASIFLSLPVEQLPPVQIEKRGGQMYWIKDIDGETSKCVGLKSRFNKKTGRYQLCVDSGLLQLKDYMPDDGLCMIALTMCDLFETKPDLFVAGMAAGRDRAAIFSLLRYDPNLSFSKEFWYDIKTVKKCKQSERHKLLLLRSCRLLVHEINHLLGIDHCIFYSCCMNGSGHLDEDFRQPMFLCPVDIKKLQTLCGFNVGERYKKMKSFFVEHGMTEEVDWLNNRIEKLEGS